jgi:hypothetical protein
MIYRVIVWKGNREVCSFDLDAPPDSSVRAVRKLANEAAADIGVEYDTITAELPAAKPRPQ